MCGVLDFDQIGCLQAGLEVFRLRHHLGELRSLRDKISARSLWFVHDSHDAARVPRCVRDRIPVLNCELRPASRGGFKADRRDAAKQPC